MRAEACTYVKCYAGQTKWMYCLVESYDLLEKYNSIWDKVNTDIKKNFIASLSMIKTFWESK